MKEAKSKVWKYSYTFEVFAGDMSIAGVKNAEKYFESLFDPKTKIFPTNFYRHGSDELMQLDQSLITNVEYDLVHEHVSEYCYDNDDYHTDHSHYEWRLQITFDYPMTAEELEVQRQQEEKAKEQRRKSREAAAKRKLKKEETDKKNTLKSVEQWSKNIAYTIKKYPDLADTIKKMVAEKIDN